MRAVFCVASLFLLLLCDPLFAQNPPETDGSPNLRAQLSDKIIKLIIERNVDQIGDVDDRDGETTKNGISHTIGRTTVELIPDPHRASVQLVLTATVHAHLAVSQGPVKLFVTTVLPFQARRPIWIDAHGVHTTQSWACGRFTDGHLHCVTTKFRRLLDRVVSRFAGVVYERKNEKELRKALPGALKKILDGFDEKVIPELQELNETYYDVLRKAYKAKTDPKEIHFSTTANAIFAKATIATNGQPPITTAAPEFSTNRDVAIQVHENVINATMDANLAGQEFTDKNFQARLTDILGPMAKKLEPKSNGEPWTIRFAKKNPLRVKFADQEIALVTRFTKIASGKRALNKEIDIHVHYRIEKSPNGLALVRTKPVDPKPRWFKREPGKPYPASVQVERSWIRRSLQTSVFKERLVLKNIELTGKLAGVGAIAVSEMHAKRGWLAVAWQRRAKKSGK